MGRMERNRRATTWARTSWPMARSRPRWKVVRGLLPPTLHQDTLHQDALHPERYPERHYLALPSSPSTTLSWAPVLECPGLIPDSPLTALQYLTLPVNDYTIISILKKMHH